MQYKSMKLQEENRMCFYYYHLSYEQEVIFCMKTFAETEALYYEWNHEHYRTGACLQFEQTNDLHVFENGGAMLHHSYM